MGVAVAMAIAVAGSAGPSHFLDLLQQCVAIAVSWYCWYLIEMEKSMIYARKGDAQ